MIRYEFTKSVLQVKQGLRKEAPAIPCPVALGSRKLIHPKAAGSQDVGSYRLVCRQQFLAPKKLVTLVSAAAEGLHYPRIKLNHLVSPILALGF